MSKKLQQQNIISQAVILAAGLGTRMQPLTLNKPKALVSVLNYPLIDHIITKISMLKVNNIIVNLHHHADKLEAHLKRWENVNILFSSEREELLNSGGGIKKMLAQLPDKGQPFLLFNCDSLWTDNDIGENILRLNNAWDENKMDILLSLTSHENSLGYDGFGDFYMDDDGKLKRRVKNSSAPYIYTGMAIINPSIFNSSPGGSFNLNVIFDRALQNERLFGNILNGSWLHVGTPNAREEAEKFLEEENELKKLLLKCAPTPKE